MPVTELNDEDLTIRIIADKRLTITDTNVRDFIDKLRVLDDLSPLQEYVADRSVTPGTLKITFQDGREITATTVQNSLRVLDWTMTGVYELQEVRAVLNIVEAVDRLADNADMQTLDVALA